MNRAVKVLIIPLDWGLGHATRCIPIVQYMQSKGWEVTLAGEGQTAALLSSEFPNTAILPIKGYRITYPKSRWLFIPKIIFQIPKIIAAIVQEHFWLKKMISTYQWDIVISDNRYGLFTSRAKTILITHQLSVITGAGKPMDGMLRAIIYSFIDRFNVCWVPDTEDKENISGKLSHPKALPVHTEYIGPLSRVEQKNVPESDFILLLLSGPEPQRTALENILIKEASKTEYKFLCVRGLPASSDQLEDRSNIRFVNHLNADELARKIEASILVICRTGYSTVMDLIKLKKKAIMIPTPGQTEQEYLGRHLGEQRWYIIQNQEEIDLPNGIHQCMKHSAPLPDFDFNTFSKHIDRFGIECFGA